MFLVFRSIYVSRPRIYRIFCALTKVHQILVLLDIKFFTLDPLGAKIQPLEDKKVGDFEGLTLYTMWLLIDLTL